MEREPSAQPITKMEFEFERRRINMDDVRELIYREVREPKYRHWTLSFRVPLFLFLFFLNGHCMELLLSLELSKTKWVIETQL